MEKENIWVRHFNKSDVPQLLSLMKNLAKLENYIDLFCVTEEEIINRGLCENPQFYALVAGREGSDLLIGMAVMYIIPYTYTLKPNMILKELFVSENARGHGLGSILFESAKEFASLKECVQLMWTIMKGNLEAEFFYSSLDGMPDVKWQNWVYNIG
ncbi:MAG: GNAT family N-acetyltransferase [Alphaproteobacteria bacterium]|nr:MAG: GNAT family N-acetyltransferase [Alphaproteobacteria bacterium]